mmetsp:Transcript_13252/g.17336  ORF Transcript_13252/g.17336 Transcript_13252/m.17336 type:complete len:251 (+) Transcript_13252:31-783(+)|eukprot:CAMPEP_0116069502 /NCGR_PEP_ID=MMETSP0322-20121206/12345_1 /TAXON_ID=163516 /ORGANISM="Leptocylindrus danicus var. apora, Strain B651" /LENGTH=250 /DNA_ID=CAMNT_0003556917 /DNA_START=28 /DNA_END=780 /DNA_ORIENTATION=+
MGAVHGVYLKYVALSAISYACYSACGEAAEDDAFPLMIGRHVLAYSTAVNGVIAALFKLRWGMGLLGKDQITGQIPTWSYILWFPFHYPTLLYTHLHNKKDQNKKPPVPPASEVLPGWWVGGCYGHLIENIKWAGVVDLTSEFPETTENDAYLLVASWDGVPPNPEKLEEAATFANEAHKKGHVLVHCAHGRGRSTTVMCAALVKAGEADTYEEALKLIQKGRSVCKLNSSMRKALSAWQATYIDGKKSK